MARATRLGLKVFDSLEIIDADRIRRDLLLVDRIVYDEHQLAMARNYAELLCSMRRKDPSDVLRRFDDDWGCLDRLGRLERMANHKCKTVRSKWEIVATATLDVLENLAKLKFSELAGKAFQFFKEDCSLTDAELASPGRELAFIDSASTWSASTRLPARSAP